MLVEKRQPTNRDLNLLPTAHSISNLLAAGQYNQVNEVLQQVPLAAHAGDDLASLDSALLAARQICLACDNLRETAERHRWSAEEAERQEQDLRRQLQAIVELIQPDNPHSPQQKLTLLQTSARTRSTKDYKGTCNLSVHSGLRQRPQPALQFRAAGPSPSPTDKERARASLVIYGLGAFQAYQDDQLIKAWPNRKSKSLFKYLLWHHARPVGKETLMDLFWPETPADSARNNLNVTIYNLRQALRQSGILSSYILFQEDNYRIDPDLEIWIDFEAFAEHFENGRTLEKNGQRSQAIQEFRVAEQLYQGDLFEEDRYDDWIAPQRQALHNHYIEILDYLIGHAFDEEEYSACSVLCNKQLQVDPCRENAHRHLMRCYIAQRQHYLAIRQYHHCVQALKEQLDVAPSPETVALYEQIRASL